MSNRIKSLLVKKYFLILKKSFVTAIAAICKLLLYPNCWIVITASTIDQANKIVEDKIERELIKKISPYLLYLFENDWIKITKPADGYKIENTLNNSVLRVVAPVESSRGKLIFNLKRSKYIEAVEDYNIKERIKKHAYCR